MLGSIADGATPSTKSSFSSARQVPKLGNDQYSGYPEKLVPSH